MVAIKTDASGDSEEVKIAVIGGGPAGLAVTIGLQRIKGVRVTLYEKDPRFRQVGAGIGIQPTTWRLLDELGVSISPKDYFRAQDGFSQKHLNGQTGELLATYGHDETDVNLRHARTQRAKLRDALLPALDHKDVKFNHKLQDLEQIEKGKIRLTFQNKFSTDVSLVIGADGLTSAVRRNAFPEHKLNYSGFVAYRTIVSNDKLKEIAGLPRSVTFWQGPEMYVYTCPVSDGLWDVGVLVKESYEEGAHTQWGQPAHANDFAYKFDDWHPVVQQVLAKVGPMGKYALYGGERLQKATSSGNIVLIGDAAHPLSGGFGAGAGFGLEDAFVLRKAIERTIQTGQSVADALQIFHAIRTPHYKDLYSIIQARRDANASRTEAETAKLKALSFDEATRLNVSTNWAGIDISWIYTYDVSPFFLGLSKIQKVWETYLQRAKVVAKDTSASRSTAIERPVKTKPEPLDKDWGEISPTRTAFLRVLTAETLLSSFDTL